MIRSTPASTGTADAVTPQQKSVILAALDEVRAANEADLSAARQNLAALTAEGSLGDASMREVIAGAEYMIEDATRILSLVDVAERRTETGEYGLCATCGVAIPFERLLLRPYLSTCIACS